MLLLGPHSSSESEGKIPSASSSDAVSYLRPACVLALCLSGHSVPLVTTMEAEKDWTHVCSIQPPNPCNVSKLIFSHPLCISWMISIP